MTENGKRRSSIVLRSLALLALAGSVNPLRAETNQDKIRQAFRDLIAAENRHDEAAVRSLTWNSPSALFVAKAPDGWHGYWGIDGVIGHLHDMYQQPFAMQPDYGSERVVMLNKTVAETYAPVAILSQYGGFNTPKPFVLVLLWVKTRGGWRMATDLPIPVPPPVSSSSQQVNP